MKTRLPLLGWIAVAFIIVLILGSVVGSLSTTRQVAPPAAASNSPATPHAGSAWNPGHDGVVAASEYACEQFVKANSRLEVKKIERSFEIVDSRKKYRLKSPNEEAWVGVDYRAGSDGIAMRATCHYAKFGDDVAILDHESVTR